MRHTPLLGTLAVLALAVTVSAPASADHDRSRDSNRYQYNQGSYSNRGADHSDRDHHGGNSRGGGYGDRYSGSRGSYNSRDYGRGGSGSHNRSEPMHKREHQQLERRHGAEDRSGRGNERSHKRDHQQLERHHDREDSRRR